MLVAAIILLVLLTLALLRIGLILSYDEEGLALWLKIGFLKFGLKDTEHVKKRTERHRFNISEMKPGSLSELKGILNILKETLLRFKRKLLIKKLVLHYVSASTDPAKAAIGFGAANAVFGAVVPILDRNFKIKRRELSASADYSSNEQKIFAQLHISIAIWESIYVISTLLKMFTVIERKGKKDGKGTDKQLA